MPLFWLDLLMCCTRDRVKTGGLDECFCIVITKTSVSNRPFPRENGWAEECPQGGT